MMVIVLLLALASGAFADEYTPVDWITITEDGELSVVIGGFFHLGGSPGQCSSISGSSININGQDYSFGTAKWQRMGEDGEWTDVPGTERDGGEFCGYSPEEPGEYRWVFEMTIDGASSKYASGNTLTVEGDAAESEDESAGEEAGDETAVEAVTWGFLKSRATR